MGFSAVWVDRAHSDSLELFLVNEASLGEMFESSGDGRELFRLIFFSVWGRPVGKGCSLGLLVLAGRALAWPPSPRNLRLTNTHPKIATSHSPRQARSRAPIGRLALKCFEATNHTQALPATQPSTTDPERTRFFIFTLVSRSIFHKSVTSHTLNFAIFLHFFILVKLIICCIT